MSISKVLKNKFKELSIKDSEDLKKMAWEYKTSYQDITKRFGLTPSEVEKFMLFYLDPKDFKRWKIKLQKRFNLKAKPRV
jgi:uncharacterized protein (TIGR03643 family)